MRRVCICLLLALAAACSRPPDTLAPETLPHDAYIWQRVWTPALAASIREASGAVRSWRVLGAELDGHGAWREAGVDAEVLRASGKPVVMVVRIEGQLALWDEARLRGAALAQLDRWRANGLSVAAVEIDHDCGTARLPAYAAFLRQLREALPGDVRLSLTALPAWLGAPALGDVLAAVDEAVLQVHAVSDPASGLFDAGRARRWMDAFGELAAKPWRVALPAYGSKVVWDDQGRIAAVDSERPSLVGGRGAIELMAAPEDMASFVAGLTAKRSDGLAGIVWFRLPTETDVRAWSLPTWLAVVRGERLRPAISALSRPAGQPGLHELFVASEGTADAALPDRVRIRGDCMAADGINFYTVSREPGGFVLALTRGALLPPGRERGIGWARCAGPPRLLLDGAGDSVE